MQKIAVRFLGLLFACFSLASGSLVAAQGIQAIKSTENKAPAAQSHPSVAPTSKPWSALGRAPNRAEIQAWDIDVRPDFKGLPPGSGSVARGQEVWEAQCESCHGAFGESNEVFTPIVGGTSRADQNSGRVSNLLRNDFPQRTTLMKLATVSTLWDYINRAMPWNAPKSLSVGDVYAVTAYILHLGEILPADFVLSDRNIAQVQKRLPNRLGMVAHDGLWRVNGKSDVQGDACMRNCAVTAQMASTLPDYARDSHGNLAQQQRLVGPMRGAQTVVKTTVQAAAQTTAQTLPQAAPATGSAGAGLAKSANCLSCHGISNRLVGPSFNEVARRYQSDEKAGETLAKRIRHGGQGVWGAVPMPAQVALMDEEIAQLVRWILSGAL